MSTQTQSAAARSALVSPRDDVEQRFAEIHASLTPALQLLVDEPAGLLPIEMEDFRHQLVLMHDAMAPQDALELLQVVQCAVHAVEARRYRRAEAELLADRAKTVMRAAIGATVLVPADVSPEQRQKIQAEAAVTNEALVRDWMRGDAEARRKIRILIQGRTTETEVLAKASDITMLQRRDLNQLVSRAEAAIRRAQRDLVWRRNMKRLMLKDGLLDAAPGNDNRSLAEAEPGDGR